MADLSSITSSPAVYPQPAKLVDYSPVVVQPAPSDVLLERDVVTNNIPRMTVGRQSQVGSSVTYARLRDSRELRPRVGGKSSSSALGLVHPLLPDPDTQGFHDIAAADVTPQAPTDIHAQAPANVPTRANALALAFQSLTPAEQHVALRAMQAQQNGAAQRQLSTRNAAGAGLARMRAPGTGVQSSLFNPDAAVQGHDAVELDAVQNRPLGETMQSRGANPLVDLLDRQRTLDAATQSRLYLTGRINDGVGESSFARFVNPRTPLEHVMHQADAMTERASRWNQLQKANSTAAAGDAAEAELFRQVSEAKPPDAPAAAPPHEEVKAEA